MLTLHFLALRNIEDFASTDSLHVHSVRFT
jgi:hypothetical protein